MAASRGCSPGAVGGLRLPVAGARLAAGRGLRGPASATVARRLGPAVPTLWSTRSVTAVHGLQLFCGIWDPPGTEPGVEPASPALADGLFSTEPLGNLLYVFKIRF